MAIATKWALRGRGYGFCNCGFGCGCNCGGICNSKDGNCRASVGFAIDRRALQIQKLIDPDGRDL